MKANVYYKNILAGIIEKTSEGYFFKYDQQYLSDPSLKSISLTLPKKQKKFQSSNLFPFFHGLLTEGFISKTQSRKLKIDESDYFKRLISTADIDTIGCVTIKEIK